MIVFIGYGERERQHGVLHSQVDTEQPIVAVAYLGGHYFDARSDLPLHIGDSLDRAHELLDPRSLCRCSTPMASPSR